MRPGAWITDLGEHSVSCWSGMLWSFVLPGKTTHSLSIFPLFYTLYPMAAFICLRSYRFCDTPSALNAFTRMVTVCCCCLCTCSLYTVLASRGGIIYGVFLSCLHSLNSVLVCRWKFVCEPPGMSHSWPLCLLFLAFVLVCVADFHWFDHCLLDHSRFCSQLWFDELIITVTRSIVCIVEKSFCWARIRGT